ncbi:histidine kinase 2 isoform X2 [Cornus florida]|uniref:histidine kinase 2 isoform X2 n=1 Tax=Cornus florida TaxID=4283 RepID=UPI00289EFF34|nr:histidine kinase 2 isoform X2 [Cornus florida]
MSFNGKLSANFKLKKAKEPLHGSNCVWKWRRHLLFLGLLGIVIWFFSGLNDGVFRRKEEIPSLFKDKARILLEHFNVSKDQLRALASLFSESDQVLGPEKQEFRKQHGMGVDVVPDDQCPVQDENNPRKLGLWLLEDKSLSFVSQSTSPSSSPNHQNDEENALQRRAPGSGEECCGSCSFCFVNVCWWIILGVVVSCKMPSLHEKLQSQNQKPVQLQPLAQQQQQLLLQKQQNIAQNSSKSAGKWRKKLLIMFVLAGVTGSIWLFWHLKQDIVVRRRETLANMCDERARMLQDQFNVSMNHVHALAILISMFHHGKQPSAIDQKTFGEYTQRTAFERPLTSGVAYALKVPHSERREFEKQHGWKIKKMETEDQTLVQDCLPENLDPSPIQDEYAPVILTQETVSHIVSIDMMSGKEDRENILRARASGKGVLTSPFKLLKSNHLGVVLTFAVYNSHLPPNATPEQRINATVGYLGASYDVPSLVEKLLHQLASKQTIVVNVYDTTNKSATIKMYGTDAPDTGLLHNSSLDFGDPARKHEMHCSFKQKPPPPWTAITASVGVLVITLLLGHIFHAAINRIAKVERDCQTMLELKQLAEAADVAKSQFLATVSHEIRTPMNGVLGMLQMLMDTDLDANQLDYVQTAHASGKDLISLINEVLDQAKIESGRLELEAVPFDLRAVLDNVLSLFSVKFHEKGIELAIYISDQVPEVVIGDPGRFRQIITNLVGNSIKFTHDKGHIFVSVHLAEEVRTPLYVRDEVLKQSLTLVQDRSNNSYNTLSGFPVVDRWKSWENFKMLSGTDLTEETKMIKLLVTVEDTGVGIPLEAQGRIFTPFMQADSSTSRTYGGTGIGLSISKRLVDLMNGEIGFVSKPGTGSTFSFTATLAKGETSSLETNRQQYNPTVSEFQGLKALVVDSRSIRAEVTRYHLQRLGMSTDIVSRDFACSYLSSYSNTSASSHLNMILVEKDDWDKEIGLPLHQLLRELRPNGCSEVPEILPKLFLLATSISSTERNELKSAGFVDDVLTKPLRLSVLISCFREALGIGKKRQLNRGKLLNLGSLLRDKRILVVDDNAVNRRVAEGALKKYGATVTCVESGKAAVAMLKPPHSFDACFMDLQMPEMDGFEATRQIRCLEHNVNEKIEYVEASTNVYANMAHWHTPILAMTADVIQATNEECVKCGMDDYVSKPFEEEQLYLAVARFFESG